MAGPMPVHDPIAGSLRATPAWVRWFHDLLTGGVGDAATLQSHAASYFSTSTHLHTGTYVPTATIGRFTDIAFDPAHFTATVGLWTVILGGQVTYCWTLDGKRMTVCWQINGSTTTQSGGALHLALPAGYQAARAISGQHDYQTAAGGWDVGSAEVVTGATVIDLYLRTRNAWPAEATTISTRGQLTLEVV